MLQLLYGLVIWIIVPGIMLAMLIFSLVIIAHVDESEPKVVVTYGGHPV